MIKDTLNHNQVTEDEQKELDRINELASTEELSEEESNELKELKKTRQTRLDKRIGELTYRAKSAEEKAREAEEKILEANRKIEELEGKVKTVDKPIIRKETVQHEGKNWYTDDTLLQMIKSGELTDQQAFEHQRQRDRAEDRDILRNENKKNSEETENNKIRTEDAMSVAEKYPHFSKSHPSFNPNDPVYKLASELYDEGLKYNPKGLSKSIKRAEEILGINNKKPDISDDLSTYPSNPGVRQQEKEKEITLTKEEEDFAVKTWCRGDIVNPRTGMAYTEKEAVNKYLEAKKGRR